MDQGSESVMERISAIDRNVTRHCTAKRQPSTLDGLRETAMESRAELEIAWSRVEGIEGQSSTKSTLHCLSTPTPTNLH